jgi:hypothetical protein
VIKFGDGTRGLSAYSCHLGSLLGTVALISGLVNSTISVPKPNEDCDTVVFLVLIRSVRFLSSLRSPAINSFDKLHPLQCMGTVLIILLRIFPRIPNQIIGQEEVFRLHDNLSHTASRLF